MTRRSLLTALLVSPKQDMEGFALKGRLRVEDDDSYMQLGDDLVIVAKDGTATQRALRALAGRDVLLRIEELP